MNTIWIVLPVLLVLMFQLGIELDGAAFPPRRQTPESPLRGAGRAAVAASGRGVRRRNALPPAARLLHGADAHRLLPGRQFVKCLLDAGQGRRRPLGDAHGPEQHHHALHHPARHGICRPHRRTAHRDLDRPPRRQTHPAEHRAALPAHGRPAPSSGGCGTRRPSESLPC